MRNVFALILFAIVSILELTAQYNYVPQSKLATGSWFRIGVTEDGIYAISPQDLQSLGAGNALPIQSIRVHGHGGSMLPEKNGVPNPDDLPENPVKAFDLNGDGIFNGSDYILFYGKGPNEWVYSNPAKSFSFKRNIYTDTTHYFVSVNNGTALSIPDLASVSGSPDYVSGSFDDFLIIENDSVNLIASGRRWFWRDFKFVTSHTVSGTLPGGFRPDSAIKVNVMMAARCISCTSAFSVSANGQNLGTIPVASTCSECNYAVDGLGSFTMFTASPQFSFTINRVSPASQGIDSWLDYISLNGRRNPARVGTQMNFTDKYSLGKALASYSVANAAGTLIWDVTDPTQAKNVLHSNGNFALPGDVLRRFIVAENGNFKRPALMGAVANQNLHGLGYADNIVITHPAFFSEAKRLADYHAQNDGVSYHLLTTRQVFDEFSSGVPDPTAIRNFVRMFYQRKQDGVHPMPRYLTLFGDGSYDTKTHLNRSYKDSSGVRTNINTDFVPSWQTENSYSQGGATFSTDDYFGIMAMDKGGNEGSFLPDYLQIGIGRILVRTPQEAKGMVDKFIHYMEGEACKGDWRNRVLLMADDEDAPPPQPDFLFIPINEELDQIVQTKFPTYNVDKLYLDAYTQVTTAGQRYPDAEKALADKMSKGTLLINFIGHGGEKGLTKERLMQTEDVDTWNTINNLPLWITATCTFTRFDDPQYVSAGEYVLMKPDGGGIGLISTSRPIAPSTSQSKAYMNAVFTRDTVTGEMPRLGDIVKNGKNNSGGVWGIQPLLLLFGDPALRLAYPEYNVETESVTNEAGDEIDTLRATQVVTIRGKVTDHDGFTMGDFNGWVYPTVFDKFSTLRTKQNDPAATEYVFNLQKNILFKGKTRVENGSFEFTFKVPLDINYSFGPGKISYYAENGVIDANGYKEITVGGSENNCEETQGPVISLYINDDKFMNGSVVGANPTVYAKLADESGINLSGAGIGHDLMVSLKGPLNEEYIVNDFYLADPGSYQSGTLTYPLRKLPAGDYSLSLRAWDACNNSGTTTIYFRVDTSQLIVNNLYNYPNPTNGGTTFSFEHNFAETDLQADLRIYTLQGTLVKRISQTVNSPGYRSVELYWDGNMDGGGQVAAGLYVYTLYLSNGKGKAVKASNKLVITE